MKPRTDSRKFKTISRRELLKLTPVLSAGAFAIPQLQNPLLKGGLGFSDWASARLFRSGHLAPTFADADLTPFEKFPINGYDVDDPGMDFDKWTLTVTARYKNREITRWRKFRHCRRSRKIPGMSVWRAGT